MLKCLIAYCIVEKISIAKDLIPSEATCQCFPKKVLTAVLRSSFFEKIKQLISQSSFLVPKELKFFDADKSGAGFRSTLFCYHGVNMTVCAFSKLFIADSKSS